MVASQCYAEFMLTKKSLHFVRARTAVPAIITVILVLIACLFRPLLPYNNKYRRRKLSIYFYLIPRFKVAGSQFMIARGRNFTSGIKSREGDWHSLKRVCAHNSP